MFKSKNILFIVLLTLCLWVGMGQCEFGKNLRYTKSPSGEDLICVYKFGVLRNCYPKVFKPTHEYQLILEGQEIPKGLDVQISMKTGERRAKLPDNYNKPSESESNSQPQPQPHEIVMIENEEGKEDNNENQNKDKTYQKVQIHTGKYKSSESPYVENPKDNNNDNDDSSSNSSSSDSDDNEDDDNEVVRIQYQDKISYSEAFSFLSKAKTIEEKIEYLEQIEDIVHHIEFGQELMKSLPEFIHYLKDENTKIRALSAICIGSSLQNNPKARKTAIKQHLYDSLIERLTNEKDITVLKRLCYAFSNLVRGDTKMIKKLHQSKNLGLLYHLYMNQPSLRNKLESLITDIFDPNKMKEGTKLNEFLDKEGAQLWCSAFQNNIISNEGYLPDILNSLSILIETGECSNLNPNLRPILQNLSKTQPELFEDGTHDLKLIIKKILDYQQSQKPFKEL